MKNENKAFLRDGHGDREDDVDVGKALRNIVRYPLIFASVFIVVIVTGLCYAVLITPKYKADGIVQIDLQQGSALGSLADVATALQLGTNSVDGELDVVTSRATVYPAIKALKRDVEISVDNRLPILGKVIARKADEQNYLREPLWGLARFAWGGEKLELDQFDVPKLWFDEKFYLTVLEHDSWELRDSDDQLVARGLVGETKLFTLQTLGKPESGKISVASYRGRVGTRFRVVKRSVQSVYEDLDRRLNAAQTARDSNTIEVTYTDKDPEFAAALLNEIAAAYLRLNIEHRAEQSRLSLEFLRKKLPTIRQTLENSQKRLNEYRIKTKTIDIDGQTQALLDRAAELTRQKMTADLAFQAQSELLMNSHPAQRAQQVQSQVLAAQLSAVDQQLKALPLTEQEYLRLSLDVEVNTKLYTSLLENEQQLEVVDAGTTGNVFLVEKSVAPERPSWPRLPIVLGGAAILGLSLGFMAVQLRAALLGTMRDPLEAEQLANIPLYAVVPSSKRQRQQLRSFMPAGRSPSPMLLAHTTPGDRSVEALRSLRSAMQFLPGKHNSNVLLFTGPTPKVGKTFISTNFAYLLASTGKRVLLIDADMRRTSFHRYLLLGEGPALAEVLAGKASVESAIRKNVFPLLDVLPAADETPKNPAELLEREAFSELIQLVSAKYDHVIIDSPPILPVSDSLWISKHAGAVIMVSRAEVTNPRHLVDSIARLTNVGAKVAGQVFNGFEPAGFGYGYGYGYGYEYYSENATRS